MTTLSVGANDDFVQQEQGHDYSKSYIPVNQWSSVYLYLILPAILVVCPPDKSVLHKYSVMP
jgi:hypothetical protein